MTSCPASWRAFTDSGYLSTQSPTTKKVALTLYLPRMSMRAWVSSLPHAASKLMAQTFSSRSTRVDGKLPLGGGGADEAGASHSHENTGGHQRRQDQQQRATAQQ